jgi:Zn-dependent membrane protease YugP
MILLLFLGTLLISLLAQWRVKRAFARHSQTPTRSGYTGAEVAGQILSQAGITDVEIVEHEEMLGDHYDPINRRLVLSSDNYHGTSAAALGIAAHECGHALQHKTAYAPLQLRMAAVGITTFASQLVLWIPLLGLMTGMLAGKTALLIMAMAWGVLMAFNLITLPVEFDASRRAKIVLGHMGFIQAGPEQAAVNQVLNAAAWTYVAAFISSLVYFLWHLVPLLGGGSNDED